MRGYYWDQRTNSLKYKKKGVDAFCFGIGLLALKGQRACRELLETRFFELKRTLKPGEVQMGNNQAVSIDTRAG